MKTNFDDKTNVCGDLTDTGRLKRNTDRTGPVKSFSKSVLFGYCDPINTVFLGDETE